MTGNSKHVAPKQTRIGAAAARSAQALKDFKQAELDRRKEVKQKREELEDAAAAAAVQLRRMERERRRDEEYFLIGVLGRAAMTALRSQGIAGILVSAEEVFKWPQIDLARLRYHLQQPEEPQIWRDPELDDQVVYNPGGPPEFDMPLLPKFEDSGETS